LTHETFESIVRDAGARIIFQNHNGYIVEAGGASGQRRATYLLTSDDVAYNAAKDTVGLLRGERPPVVINWMSRITGYYSLIRTSRGWGWNMSKIAELHDRQKGNYGVPE